MPSAQQREKWNSAGKDVVVLHMFGRAKRCPNPSPYPIKLETYLRMADIKYVTDFDVPMSSKGKSPWMTFNGKDIADSQFCIDHLAKTLDKDMSQHLSPSERATARAFRALIEDNLYFCVAYYRWVVEEGKIVRSDFPPMPVPGFLQGFIIKQITKNIRKQCEGQGIGRHTKEEILSMAMGDLKALSDHLGNKLFFMGDQPCEIDCTVFGFTCLILFASVEGSAMKKAMEDEFVNLKEYTLRMKEKYWPDWEECQWKGK